MRLDAARGLIVRLPSWLGDFVSCEPAVRALHGEFARRGVSDRLALCGPQRLLELFDGRFDGARRVPVELGWRAWRGHGAALLLTGSWRSAWWAVRARISERIGVARDGRAALLTFGVAPARERGAAALRTARRGAWPRLAPRPLGAVALELVSAIGVPSAGANARLEVSREARAQVDARLAALVGSQPFVLVNAGGRPGSAKALAANTWGELLATLPRETAVLASYGPGEEDTARALVRVAHGRPIALCFDDRAPTLPEYLALLERCERFITTDSGPRHLARALGVRADVLFGPTDPRHTLEGLATERLVIGRAPCAPCHLERCPLEPARDRACLVDAAARLIARGW